MTLAILPNWLGDLVMVEPAVRELRMRGPVTGVVAPELVGLVEDRDLVDRIEVFDRRRRDRGLGGLWRVGGRLRGESSAYVFGPSLRAAALAAAGRVPRRIGLGGAGREFFLTEVHRPGAPSRTSHLADDWLGLVTGSAASDATSEWSVGPRGQSGFHELAGTEPVLLGGYAAFATSANFGATKEWPAASFAEVATALRERFGLIACFVGSSSSSEVARAEALASVTGGISLAGRTDLPTFAAVLASARIFVGNDSGPMHLAAALGTPTVGIFGSTSPVWTGPRGRSIRVVGPADVECTPCFRSECAWDRECLTGLQPDTVVEAAQSLLAEVA